MVVPVELEEAADEKEDHHRHPEAGESLYNYEINVSEEDIWENIPLPPFPHASSRTNGTADRSY